MGRSPSVSGKVISPNPTAGHANWAENETSKAMKGMNLSMEMSGWK
jgi:hypothetical protein